MHLIYGKRVAKIKEFTDHSHSCPYCKAFDLRVAKRGYGDEEGFNRGSK